MPDAVEAQQVFICAGQRCAGARGTAVHGIAEFRQVSGASNEIGVICSARARQA
ncbi:MAG: hypothetical protein PUD81_07670 [Eggerthellales bacterium]|nr:hypothetical protein [Eggerthellales bacterium]